MFGLDEIVQLNRVGSLRAFLNGSERHPEVSGIIVLKPVNEKVSESEQKVSESGEPK